MYQNSLFFSYWKYSEVNTVVQLISLGALDLPIGRMLGSKFHPSLHPRLQSGRIRPSCCENLDELKFAALDVDLYRAKSRDTPRSVIGGQLVWTGLKTGCLKVDIKPGLETG